MGCLAKVVKNEAGAGRLKDSDKIYHCHEVTSVLGSLTVKMRTGWSRLWNALQLSLQAICTVPECILVTVTMRRRSCC